MRCLDASHDRRLKRIDNGIARHALHEAYRVSLRLRVGITTWAAVLALDF